MEILCSFQDKDMECSAQYINLKRNQRKLDIPNKFIFTL